MTSEFCEDIRQAEDIRQNSIDRLEKLVKKYQLKLQKVSKEELTKLSGIGEAKAQDIIDYRNTNGSFKTIEEIKNISGIGDALFAKIKDNITI